MKMKKILNEWRKFIAEAEGEVSLEKAKEILQSNNFLKDYADGLQDNNLVDAGNYVFLFIPEVTFKHAKTSHMRDSDLPGSKFSDQYLTDEALLRLAVELLQKQPKPSEVQTSPYGNKFKWFNVGMGKDIGEDSIIHKDQAKGAVPKDFDFKEKIGNNRGIPSIMSQGLEVVDSDGNRLSKPEDANPEGEYYIKQPIKVIDGRLQPTDKLNLIVGELGDLQGKKFISLVTMFPGVSEPKAMNKKDYSELGYYFLTGK